MDISSLVRVSLILSLSLLASQVDAGRGPAYCGGEKNVYVQMAKTNLKGVKTGTTTVHLLRAWRDIGLYK